MVIKLTAQGGTGIQETFRLFVLTLTLVTGVKTKVTGPWSGAPEDSYTPLTHTATVTWNLCMPYRIQGTSEDAQLCLTLCHPMDCSLPASFIHGIFQTRVLEWVAISFSRGSSPTQGSNPGLLHCRQTLYRLSHQGSPTIIWRLLHSILHCFDLKPRPNRYWISNISSVFTSAKAKYKLSGYIWNLTTYHNSMCINLIPCYFCLILLCLIVNLKQLYLATPFCP